MAERDQQKAGFRTHDNLPLGANPPNTTEWIAPSLAHANMAIWRPAVSVRSGIKAQRQAHNTLQDHRHLRCEWSAGSS